MTALDAPVSPPDQHDAAANRVPGLDGLRAIAALLVFFHHVGFASAATFTSVWGGYLARMDVGVPVFFALSGFLLFRPVARSVIDDTPLRPLGEHLWRRALRIYPAFWVALALIVLFTSEGFRDTGGAVLTALLLHIHSPTHVIGPIPQAWSLATEVTFYLALPLIARLVRPWLTRRPADRRAAGLFTVVAALYVGAALFRILIYGLDNRWTPAAVLWLPATFDYFAIGMAFAVGHVAFRPGTATRARIDRLAAPAAVWWGVAFAVFIVVSQCLGLARGLEVASWPREMLRQVGYGAIAFALLFPLVFGTTAGGATRRFVAHPVMHWLGLISYSIYLWHMVFVVHLEGDVDTFLGRYWTLVVTAGAATLVAATLSYYLVERWGLARQSLVRRPVADPTPTEGWVGRALDRWQTLTFRAQLFVIAGGGLALRVVYVIAAKRDQTLDPGPVFPGDQFYYSLAADELADGRGFVVPWELEQSIPAADHPPLTALVSTPASFLPGADGTHVFEQRLTMCLVGAAVIVVMGYLGRAVAGRTVGVATAVAAALYPGFWINDGLVMAESLTTLAIAGALWAVYRYRETPRLRTALEIGAWIGMATLARAESLLLAPLLVVPLVMLAHASWRERIARVAAAAVVVILVLAPWVGPNLVRFEEPVLLSTNDGLTLLGANCDAMYDGDAIGFWTLECAEAIDTEGLDQSEVSRVYRSEAQDYILDNLTDVPRVVAFRVARLWNVYRPLQMADWNTGEGREIWASLLALGGFALVVPLAVIGGWRARRRSVEIWPFVVLIGHVTLIAAAFYGIVRFRVPAEIGLVVLAAVAVTWLSSLRSCHLAPTSSSRPSSSSRSSSSTASSVGGS